MKKIFIQRSALVAGVLLLLLVASFCGIRVHTLSQRQKDIKRDYSDVNSVSYGLLSVSQWRDLVIRAVDNQIENFSLSREEQDSLEREIEGLLNALIDKADSLMRRPQRSLGGKIRALAFHVFVKPSKLHQEVPDFAHKIMAEVMRPRSRNRLAHVARSKLEDLGRQTYDSAHDAQQHAFDSVFRLYHVQSQDEFNKKAGEELGEIKAQLYVTTGVMLASLLLLLGVWWLVRRQRQLYVTLYILSIVMAFIFLFTGLTSVMIEIDARIDSLNFHVIGETISFRDQVIFFQSKSILDVVILLIQTGKYDSILVGVLILCFSIVFPISKLICTGLYIVGKRPWTKNRFVRYFAFHSGKWSMADVMVVAIFMAYIGFNGILNDQMKYLNFKTSAFTSIATNHTSLQPGYLVFVSYVLFGLVLSQLLQKLFPEKERSV